MILIAQPDGTDIVWDNGEEEFSDATDLPITELAELSLNSVVGISSPSTMKLTGSLGNTDVVVMIDSGASHNFISTRLVNQPALTPHTAGNYGVLTGAGIPVKGEGICRELTLLVQGLRIRADFLPLALGSADVILGMQWLASLGEMKVNWGLQWMRFTVDNAEVTLQGDPTLCCSELSLKAWLKAVEHGELGVIVEYNGLQSVEQAEPVGIVPSLLQQVLERYPEVFSDPQGLPPSRGRAHEINLEPGVKPEHQDHLEMVLSVLQEQQLYANKKKCQFGCKEIEYLGHIISGDGVAVNPQKIHAMVSWLEPKNIKALRGFLGLTGYYRKFVRGYGDIAKPLTSLLKKDQFQWSVEAGVAFQRLKQAMTTVPVLALVDFSELFVIKSDASGIGLGAVLMQQQKPIAFFSQALTDRQKLKSVYERELMAIVLAIQRWRHYLLGRKFLVRTDQKSLKFLLEQREVNAEYQQWLTKILGFDFDIVYKPGLENKAADALSRREGVPQLFALSIPGAIQLDMIQTEVDKDMELSKIKAEVLQNVGLHPEFSVVQGRLLKQGKLVIPKSSILVRVLLHEFHSSPMGGHGGILKTQRRLGDMFYWKGMMADIKQYVAACLVCEKHKYSTLAPAGLLQPLPIPVQVWEDISMDFVEGLPKSEGFEVVMVVVDRLSKYAHFVKLKHPYDASSVASLFVQEIVRLHGFPKTLISDRDVTFTGRFWTALFKLAGTSLNFSTAYHPQTDGQTEVTNRGLETILRCFSSDKPSSWSTYLPWAELCYNTSYHYTIQMSPFKALYGRDPPTLLKYEDGSTRNAKLEGQLKERDAMIQLLRQHILKAQQLMKHRADSHRREVEFKVGDMVFLKLKPYRQQSLARRVNEKLAARFYGPFEVAARVGAVSYKLKLPPSAKIHHTFHISQLKLAVGSSFAPSELPAPLSKEGAIEATPEAYMGFRVNKQSGQEEVLIKWKDLPDCDSTWEWKGVIQEQFPHFNLEDKVLFKAAGIDTVIREKTPLVHQYRRRKNRMGNSEGKSGPSMGQHSDKA
ncbi:hypothetical protein AALP_AA4G124900 [Arabis alpina]|nr:hypothetical protein AALP_AA4G124900 [Arabis alpina]